MPSSFRCADVGKKCCTGMRAACPQGTKCCVDSDGIPYCGANNDCYPTLTFPHVQGITDGLFSSSQSHNCSYADLSA